ncbi:MAG: hypothetical protein ABIJ18_04175 [archaeon]
MVKKYNSFKKALQGLHGLSDEEADAFFLLCNNKIFCVNDVKKILVDIKAHKKSRSTAYNLVEKFVKVGLITQVNNGSKKQEYECVHPRAIYNELKIQLTHAEKELPELETSYETSDFKSQDPREKSKILKSENEIYSICYSLRDCKIDIVHDGSPIMTDFLERIKDCGCVKKGATNVIIFKNDEKGDNCGVIELLKRTEKGAKVRLYGYLLYDEEKYNYFKKKEVKK